MATYTDVTWARREGVTSAKLQQMADNEAYLKAAVDAAPRGILCGSKMKTIFTMSGNPWFDVTGLACSSTYEAGRNIKVSFHWQGLLPWGSPGIWAVQLQAYSTQSPIWTPIAEAYVDCTTDHLIVGGGSLFATGNTTVAGSGQWKVNLRLIGGSSDGSMSMYATKDGPAELIVEDIGRSITYQ